MSAFNTLPRIAVTMGDPAGIGPKICLRMLTDAAADRVRRRVRTSRTTCPGVAASRAVAGTGPTFLVKPDSCAWAEMVFSIAVSRRKS